MSPGSFVGRVEPDGRFVAQTVTYDGHPTGVGAALATVLACPWAEGRPSAVLAELADFRHWWSIGPDLPGPTRVGSLNQRPHEQDLPLASGRLGRTFHGQQEWGHLFRAETDLLVVRRGERWRTPLYPILRWALISVEGIDRVDWVAVQRTGTVGVRER